MTEEKLLELIKETRKARKITQKEIAEYLGISQNQYSNYESGKSELSIKVFLNIVQFLDLEIFNIVNMISKDDFNLIANVIDKYRNA